MTDKPRPDEILEQLRQALTELRLSKMAETLDVELADESRQDDDVVERLWRIVEAQLRYRRERAVQRRIDAARFPCRKTLDNFDFAFQPNLSRQRVMALATLDFIRRGENLLIGGMSGTGKSHICIALGYLACMAGFRTRYTTSAKMLSKLHASLADDTLPKALKLYVRPDFLIIDEVGLDRPEREQIADAQLFYRVIQPRYEQQLSTLITSNIHWEDWGQYLGDDIATVAVLDRLVHHGHLLSIDGPSYRAAEHSKLNAPHQDNPDAVD